MSDIKLYQGDCLEIMKDIPDQSVDFILTDLPYGTTSCSWDTAIPFQEMWAQINRVIKPKKAISLFGDEPFSSALRMSNIANYKYDWVWDKVSPRGFLNSKKRPMKRTENIMIFSNGCPPYYPIMRKGKMRAKGNYNHEKSGGKRVYGDFKNVGSVNDLYFPTNLISISNAVQKGKVHPTQKPVELLEYLIQTYTLEGEIVLDFTAGVMSTAIACMNTNRNGIMIEKDENYFNIGASRCVEHAKTLDNTQAIVHNQ